MIKIDNQEHKLSELGCRTIAEWDNLPEWDKRERINLII